MVAQPGRTPRRGHDAPRENLPHERARSARRSARAWGVRARSRARKRLGEARRLRRRTCAVHPFEDHELSALGHLASPLRAGIPQPRATVTAPAATGRSAEDDVVDQPRRPDPARDGGERPVAGPLAIPPRDEGLGIHDVDVVDGRRDGLARDRGSPHGAPLPRALPRRTALEAATRPCESASARWRARRARGRRCASSSRGRPPRARLGDRRPRRGGRDRSRRAG